MQRIYEPPHDSQRLDDVVVVIPAFNEERFIGSVVLKALRYVDTVLVVDDGSADDTASIAQAAGAIVVRHVDNAGKGTALNTGFMAARDYNPAAVVTLDGDWQHMPEELGRVAAPILNGEADVVIGSRYLAHTSDVPMSRIVGHWGFTNLTNVLSGTSLSDSQSGYRAFSRTALEKLAFTSRSFSVESEMQFLIKDHALRVAEVPITIRYHERPKRNVLQHGMIVLNGIMNLVAQHRPLLFFGGSGLLVLALGVALGGLVAYTYSLNLQLGVGRALLAVLLCVIGMIMLSTGVTLHALRGFVFDHLKRPGEGVAVITLSPAGHEEVRS